MMAVDDVDDVDDVDGVDDVDNVDNVFDYIHDHEFHLPWMFVIILFELDVGIARLLQGRIFLLILDNHKTCLEGIFGRNV